MLEDMEEGGALRRPTIPPPAEHSAHIYYVLVPTAEERSLALAGLAERGISATFHYSPLHVAAAGRRFGKISGSLKNTEELASRLIRLPLYADISPDDQMRVAESLGFVLGLQKTGLARKGS
jgi:dTDP-4-amino-4,6-dideoxygalactose transaminase